MTNHTFTAAVADEIMEALIAAHEGLDEKKSAVLNARLVLSLAADLATKADLDCVRECIRAAQHE